MEFKRMMVLANSYKKQPGRCVAGRELGEGNAVGAWLRPISDLPEGELLPRHMVTANGSPLEVLDIVDVPLDHHAKDKCHPEDWVLATSDAWRHRKKFPVKDLVGLEEKPGDLWAESTTHTNRVTTKFLLKRPEHQSLYLIRPTNFRVELTNEYNPFEGHNEKKRRACFTYNGQDFSLGLTDPIFIDAHAKKFPAPNKPAIFVHPPSGDNCLICVSLTPLFEKTGYHYKVVATVLELP